MRVGVAVEAVLTSEADEGDAEFPGQIDGQTGGGADGDDESDPGAEGFLNELEAGSTAPENDLVGTGKGGMWTGGDQVGADQFVHGVVAAHIFIAAQERSLKIEESGAVGAAGFLKESLCTAELGGEGGEQVWGEGEILIEGLAAGGLQGLEAGLATDAAARGGVEISLQPGHLHRYMGLEVDLNAVWLIGVGADFCQVFFALQEVFAEEKPPGQGGVVAGSAHGDGDGAAGRAAKESKVQFDLEGLFDEEGVLGEFVVGGEGPAGAVKAGDPLGDQGHGGRGWW